MKQTILIEGLIGSDSENKSYTENDFVASLQDGLDELDVFLNSDGGYAITAWKIHYAMKELQNKFGVKIRTIALKKCKSCTTIIHLAVPEENRYVSDDTDYMIHEAWIDKGGKASELRAYADAMEEETNKIKGLYASETTLTPEELTEMLYNETTLNADEAIKYGFASQKYEQFQNLALNLSVEENPAIQKALENSLGYKRKEMPQIDKEFEPMFFDYFLAKYGENFITREQRQIDSLKPAQKELNFIKVYEKIGANGWKNREYIISKDGYLIDGHHDWAAGMQRLQSTLVNVIVMGAKARDIIQEANKLKITYNAKLMEEKKTIMQHLTDAMNAVTNWGKGKGGESAKNMERVLSTGEKVTFGSDAEMPTVGDTVTGSDGSKLSGKFQLDSGAVFYAQDGVVVAEPVASEEIEYPELIDMGFNADMSKEDKEKIANLIKESKEAKAMYDAEKAKNESLAKENEDVQNMALNLADKVKELTKSAEFEIKTNAEKIAALAQNRNREANTSGVDWNGSNGVFNYLKTKK